MPLLQDTRSRVFPLLLGLLLLLLLAKSMEGLSVVHSLCYNFTVMTWTSHEQPWYKVQGMVDGMPFLYYDSSSNQSQVLGAMEEMVRNTKAWEDQINTLRDLGKELRIHVSDIKQNDTATGPPTLQAKLLCQQKATQFIRASWQFDMNEQLLLHIDAINNNWTTGHHPGATDIKEKWKKDQGLANSLRKRAQGDCNYWLREFLMYWPDTLEVTAPMVSSTRLPFNTSSTPEVTGSSTLEVVLYVSLSVKFFVIGLGNVYWYNMRATEAYSSYLTSVDLASDANV
ncbi:retinoic acid early transcript 1E [Tenrec ecaudatus]|uniref:retinoic acid early transcript 1E n=1 Tax=Tenrec ecaudatus TaxID=94439 RepID=UPI003F5A3D60